MATAVRVRLRGPAGVRINGGYWPPGSISLGGGAVLEGLGAAGGLGQSMLSGDAALGGPAAAGGLADAGPSALSGGVGLDGPSAGGGLAAGGASSLLSSIGFDEQTPEHINIYCPTLRAPAAGTSIAVEYKLTTSGTWLQAHPLLWIDPVAATASADAEPEPVVSAFAGVIFDLEPGTTYDVRLTITEPGQTTATLTAQRATRALPAPAPTGTGAQFKTIAAGSTAAQIQTVLNGLNPGDVLEIANGTYNLSARLSINRSGTAGQPIYIRGQSRTGTILQHTATTDFLAILTLVGASHVVIEDLTVQGAGVDAGPSGSWQTAIGKQAGTTSNYVTVRRVNARGVDRGVVNYDAVTGWLVYQCDFRGNNTWAASWTPSTPGDFTTANQTWNDDGMKIGGGGCCAFENKMYGFGDCFAHAGSPSLPIASKAVHYYRNLIAMTGDDAVEVDYGTRNLSFYDNYVANAATLWSADPIYGGPAYCFRNIAVNLWRGPFKQNDENHGQLIYNNTIIKPGTVTQADGWLWQQSDLPDGNGVGLSQVAWSHRNNIHYKSGTSPTSNIFFYEAQPLSRIDFTNNGWYPDGLFQWKRNGGGTDSAGSLAGLRSLLPSLTTLFGTQQRLVGDIIVAANVFDPQITLTSYQTEYTAMELPRLRAGTSARGAGIAIPGITVDNNGVLISNPDMGALLTGRREVVYGDIQPPVWVPAEGEVAVLSVANGRLANNARSTIAPYYESYYDTGIFNAYSGGFKNPYWGEYGCAVFFGGGHASTNNNQVTVAEYRKNDVIFRRMSAPTPWFGTGTDATTKGNNSIGNANANINFTYGEATIDGQIGSVHSYACGDILGPEHGGARFGSLFVPQVCTINHSSAGPNLAGAIAQHRIDFDTLALANAAGADRKWVRHSNNLPLGNYGSASVPSYTAFVPAQNRVYHLTQGTQPPRWIDMTTRTYQVNASGTALAIDDADGDAFGGVNSGILIPVPERNLLVAMYPVGGNLRVQWMDVSTATPTLGGTATLSQTLNVGEPWNTATWVPPAKRIVLIGVLGDNSAAYEIEIPAVLGNTWQVTRAPFGAGQTLSPPDAVVNPEIGGAKQGLSYKDFWYDERLKAIFYFPKAATDAQGTNDTAWCYRPRGAR